MVRAKTTVRASLRLSPDFCSHKAKDTLVKLFTTNVPYNAKVTILTAHGGNGFCMKVLQPWLQKSIQEAGNTFWGKPSGSYGDGGSIPFLNELSEKYPESQVVAFGVLGPFSNAHGPNEFLELTYTKKLTCALSHILASCG